MTSKADDKVELIVKVESKDTSSKVILIMLIIVLVGLVIAVMMQGGPDALLSGNDQSGVGNCGDGIDNDNDGKVDGKSEIWSTSNSGTVISLNYRF